MLKCLILDDEPHAVALLADYATKSPDLELVGSYTNPIEAFHFIQEHPVDLLFLDIQMPELTGIQLLKLLPKSTQVVFTTAYSEYALDGFELDVVDYLLKPISLERFLQSVEKSKKRISGGPIPREQKEPIQQEYLFVKTGHRTQKITLSAIKYLEGLSDYVALHTEGGKVLTLENLSFFAEHLPASQFMRVHRSYIVALARIDYIERNRIYLDGQVIPISKTYAEAFWKRVKGDA